MRGKLKCPTCGHPYIQKEAAEARLRSNRSYEDIALENARRDGTVERVTKELKIARSGGMIGRGDAADINRKATAYLRKKGQLNYFFNNKRHKR